MGQIQKKSLRMWNNMRNFNTLNKETLDKIREFQTEAGGKPCMARILGNVIIFDPDPTDSDIYHWRTPAEFENLHPEIEEVLI